MPKVITLGTSSGKPTLRRGVSAVAVQWDAEWVLFDCGEATQIQVMRAGLHSSRLSAIFITHLHGDHFNGLPGYLSTMGLDGRETPLTLIGPPGIKRYIDLLQDLKTLHLRFPVEIREFPAAAFAPGEPGSRAKAVYEAADFAVEALPLEHRIFTLGYRIQGRTKPGRFDLEKARALGIPEGPLFGRLQSGSSIALPGGRTVEPSQVLGPARPGASIAYCTDTKPCANGVSLGKAADLLVHEATFAEEQADEARDYGHSTARQAAEIASRAGARVLLMTHVSPRYQDASLLLREARETTRAAEMAEDLATFEV